jgi:hypothetical protein
MKTNIVITFLFTLSLNAGFGQADNQYKNTLKKMLEVAGTEATFQIAIKQMFGLFKQQYQNIPDNVWVDMEKDFSNTSVDELVDMLTPIYEKHITLSELNSLIEFYQTPVGKKYAEKSPLIMQESMQVGQQWGMKMGQKFKERMKEKGY